MPATKVVVVVGMRCGSAARLWLGMAWHSHASHINDLNARSHLIIYIAKVTFILYTATASVSIYILHGYGFRWSAIGIYVLWVYAFSEVINRAPYGRISDVGPTPF